MAFTLRRLFNQLKISANRSISSQSYTSKNLSEVKIITGSQFIEKSKTDISNQNFTALNFTPRSLNVGISSRIIKCPVLTNIEIIEPPKIINVDNIEDFPTTAIQLPTTNDRVEEKHAVRMIIVRKNKMKRHKLRKLRKRMKFEWAKVRQRREMRKEKEFQAVLIAQIKEAEQFDAANYVAEKIKKATEVPIPRFWKGKRLPEFIIREKLGLDKK